MRNLIRCIKLILAICVITLPAQAAELDKKWGHWMMYYYVHQDVKSVPDFIDAFDQRDMLVKKKGNIEAPLIGSLSQIFAQNPDKISLWLNKDFTPEMQSILCQSLIRENLQNRAPKSYAPLIKKLVALGHHPSPATLNPKSPADQDLLWGAFFITKDPQLLSKIINMLDKNATPTEDKIVNMAIQKAASWSILSNMRQHAIVEQLVRKQHQSTRGSVKTALATIIEKFEQKIKKYRFTKHDGHFTANFNIVSPDILEELKKPSNQGLRANVLKTAKRGDSAIFHVIFAGMELSSELKANVTYDITVQKPDGTIYFEDKSLIANQRNLAQRFSVFTVTDIAGIEFEPQDPIGTYKIDVTITDNHAKKSLSFTKSIELTE